jgi:hypothetical protein
MTAKEEKEIHWHAPEFEYQPKNELWYLSAIALALLILIFALWQKNFLFAIFIGIAAVLVISLSTKYPETLRLSAEEKGIRVDSLEFHPWEEFKYFSVNRQNSEISEIIFTKKHHSINPFLRIYAYTDELDNIKGYISKYLPEKEYEESLLDSLEKIVRF